MVSTTELSLPDGDILVHAGDFMNSGIDLEEILSFNQWLREQPFKQRVVCAGNHDRSFKNMPEIARGLLRMQFISKTTASQLTAYRSGDHLTR
jgi:3',5'-cyclic AMP phosphodiesterase CpdA